MHALRTILESLDQKPDSVKELLACLPKEEFGTDVHICSFGGWVNGHNYPGIPCRSTGMHLE
jgi:hypothetical protein